MTKTMVVRADGLLDGGDGGKLYVGTSTGSTSHETIEEAIEGLSFDHGPFLNATTRDVTEELEPLVGNRAEFRYAPSSEVRYIEVTRKQVLAVYVGTLRPS